MRMLKRIAWAFLVLHHIAWSGVDEEDTTVVIVAADAAINDVEFSPNLSTSTDDNSQQEGASSSSSSSEILKSLLYYAGLLASSSGGSLLGVHVGAHTGIYAGTLVAEYMMPDLSIKTIIFKAILVNSLTLTGATAGSVLGLISGTFIGALAFHLSIRGCETFISYLMQINSHGELEPLEKGWQLIEPAADETCGLVDIDDDWEMITASNTNFRNSSLVPLD